MHKFVLVAALAALSTAAPSIGLEDRQASCTQTLPATSCCQAVAGHTTTAFTDCGGCALATAHNSLCDIVRCALLAQTNTDSTTTLTSCAPTPTPYITKVIRSESPACTTTITKTARPCGDCGVTYDQTSTVGINCKGCALETTTTGGGVGICVCPVDTTLTSVTACIASPTAY